MFDTRLVPLTRTPLKRLAIYLDRWNVKADQITLIGFMIGMLAVPALALNWYSVALVAIALNRFFDGLDGALARIQGISDAGGYLDIVLDFIFYSAVCLGFLLADLDRNGGWAGLLMLSFMGSGATFLAFSAVSGKYSIDNPDYPQKSLYYMGGLAEGSETILFLILFCLFPQYFPILAGVFAVLCWVTTGSRLWSGYLTLKQLEREHDQDSN
ncbi:CDP-alcohol phosphatidyltransferase family protein [Gilvimarinus sp. 1_MG-2023]|uniref:CDP-alcohol phosphatidyltransferase family protein n=1 Tax=Gilvimarinus sp. 1_MG-2023 TaxID=3062638 RepID=UPI0026E1C7C2|nr:CDP-alcohol phosphatidyltransferase family protein [Gilvimarinus sp. 1_MG-2023]MDO6746453.1 CDP-alcohol phosphatidyltransferase family protein [Gilvimarinus sp. 1_MG-2023]